jgi:hypothetical protein
VTGISRKYKVFTCGNGRQRAAVVVVNKMIDALLFGQLSEEDIVVVEIIQGNLKLIATSIYLDAENEITGDLNKIENIKHFAKGRGLLVAMDSNARSKTWHEVLTNRRGRQLEELLISNRLHIVNEENELTIFESNRGSSNVDLTVVDSIIVTLINKWQCNEHERFSDHRYITFCIEKRKAITNYNYHGVKYITSEKGFKRFEDNFIEEIKNKFEITETLNLYNTLYGILTRETDIEGIVGRYQNSIATACKKFFKERKLLQKPVRYKSVPWWTTELTIMRNKVNALRRRYQRTTHDNNLRDYMKHQ